MMIPKGQKILSDYILEFNLAPMGLERGAKLLNVLFDVKQNLS